MRLGTHLPNSRISVATDYGVFRPLISGGGIMGETPDENSRDKVEILTLSGGDFRRSRLLKSSAAFQSSNRWVRRVMKELQIGDGPRIFYLPGTAKESRFVYQEIFVDCVYKRHGISINDGDCIVDAGANVGMFSVFAMTQATGLKIFAFEPVPPIYETLTKNLAQDIADTDNELHAFPYGLSNITGQHQIAFFPQSPANSTCYLEAKRSETEVICEHTSLKTVWNFDKFGSIALSVFYPFRRWIMRRHMAVKLRTPAEFTVDFKTLDNMVESQSMDTINLLKIDVEGSEFDVLDGISDSNWNRVQQLVIEISPAHSDKVQTLEADLRNRGFRQINKETMGYDYYKPDSGMTSSLYAIRA